MVARTYADLAQVVGLLNEIHDLVAVHRHRALLQVLRPAQENTCYTRGQYTWWTIHGSNSCFLHLCISP